MKPTVFSVLLCVLFSIPCLGQEIKSITESKFNGKIKGAVFDSTGDAVMPGKKIVVQGQGLKETAISNDEGEYDFNLPPGIYSIMIEERRHYEMFYPFTRSNVEIHADTVSVVNLYPAIIGQIIELVAEKSGIRDKVTILTKPPK